MIFREDLVEPSSRCVLFEAGEDSATLASFGVEANGLHVGQLDGNTAGSEPALLAGLASALSFPERPGRPRRVEHWLSAAEYWSAQQADSHIQPPPTPFHLLMIW